MIKFSNIKKIKLTGLLAFVFSCTPNFAQTTIFDATIGWVGKHLPQLPLRLEGSVIPPQTVFQLGTVGIGGVMASFGACSAFNELFPKKTEEPVEKTEKSFLARFSRRARASIALAIGGCGLILFSGRIANLLDRVTAPS